MPRLFLTDDLRDRFLGGLLTVARADGIVKLEEMSSLRSTAAELGLTMPVEEDLLLAADVIADDLAAAIRGNLGDAYRAEGSPPQEIATAFLDAALRLALSDHELVIEEVMVLREFAAALGVPTHFVPGWRAVQVYQATWYRQWVFSTVRLPGDVLQAFKAGLQRETVCGSA